MCSLILFLALCVLQTTFGRPTENITAFDVIIRMNEPVTNKENLLEEDIKLRSEELAASGTNNKRRKRRGLINAKFRRWPLNTPVNYVLNGYSQSETNTILNALDHIEQATCVKFERRSSGTGLTRYIDVHKYTGCWSYVGSLGNRPQPLSLAPGCIYEGYQGTVIHEFMHALGFYHEQSRPDRDDYITINYHNIMSGRESQFHIRNDINSKGSPYDLNSVMHYPRTAFSKNGQPTIVSKINQANSLGGSKLTASDACQINSFYECPQPEYACQESTTVTTGTTTTTPKLSTTITTTKPTTVTTTPKTTTTKPTTITTTTIQSTTTTTTTPKLSTTTTTTKPTTVTTTPKTTTTKPTTITTTTIQSTTTTTTTSPPPPTTRTMKPVTTTIATTTSTTKPETTATTTSITQPTTTTPTTRPTTSTTITQPTTTTTTTTTTQPTTATTTTTTQSTTTATTTSRPTATPTTKPRPTSITNFCTGKSDSIGDCSSLLNLCQNVAWSFVKNLYCSKSCCIAMSAA